MTEYRNLATGELYAEGIPDEVTIEVSEIVNEKMYRTRILKSRKGDPEYEGMLDSWMFRRGYMRV